MLLKEIDDVFAIGQRVIVIDTKSKEELYAGHTIGGIWHQLCECEVASINNIISREVKLLRTGEMVTKPFIVVEVYR